MVEYTWQQLSPFSLGFDETFSRLEAIAGAGTSYPPYNIVNGHDGRTVLEVALAGFSRDDIEVETERNVLTVSARKAPPCLLYTSPSPRDATLSRMPSSA